MAQKDRLPPLYVPETGDIPAAIAAWAARHRPDCIVSLHDMWRYRQMLAAGLEIPGRVGYVDLSLSTGETFLSGMCQNSREVGMRAVDFLVTMIHRLETGIPSSCAHVLTDGFWIDGKTAVPQS